MIITAHAMASKATFDRYPAFPTDLPVAVVPKISLKGLMSRDASISKSMEESAKSFGCFKIDLTDAIDSAALMQMIENGFDLGKAFFDQDLEAKLSYKLSGENVGSGASSFFSH